MGNVQQRRWWIKKISQTKICLDLHNFKWSIKSKLAAGARTAVGENWIYETSNKCKNMLKKKRNTKTVETSGEHLF